MPDRPLLVSTTAASPWGPVWIAATASGVIAIETLGTEETFEARLVRRGLGRPIARGTAPTTDAADLAEAVRVAVESLLAGTPVDASAIAIDITDRPAWDRLVLDAVRAIPRGETAGYGDVARRIGRPGAARAVGGAVARNPVGLLVPCHRVIAGDGTLGGYGAAAWGGRQAALEVKRSLLLLEGVVIGDHVSAG